VQKFFAIKIVSINVIPAFNPQFEANHNKDPSVVKTFKAGQHAFSSFIKRYLITIVSPQWHRLEKFYCAYPGRAL